MPVAEVMRATQVFCRGCRHRLLDVVRIRGEVELSVKCRRCGVLNTEVVRET